MYTNFLLSNNSIHVAICWNHTTSAVCNNSCHCFASILVVSSLWPPPSHGNFFCCWFPFIFFQRYFHYLLHCFNMFQLCLSCSVIVLQCECVFEQGLEEIHQTLRGLREASTLVLFWWDGFVLVFVRKRTSRSCASEPMLWCHSYSSRFASFESNW